MSLPTPYLENDRAVIYHADCLDILPHLSGIDCVVTDPPYGIGADKVQANRANKRHGNAIVASKDYGSTNWDRVPCPPVAVNAMRGVSKWQVIFGGNYFDLPPSRCWLVWDKSNGANDYADCELAWTNIDKPVRRISFQWHGMLRDEPGERVHPTQKPVEVMRWAISHCPDAQTILDPFMGSGTTGVACMKLGRKFIGIEIEEKYCQIAAKRIAEASEWDALLRSAQ